MDDQNVDVNSENNQVAPEQTQDQEANEQVQQNNSTHAGSREEINWRAARERQKELERELRLQRELNDRLLQAQQKPVVEPDELDSISDEDFIPKGKQKRLVKKETQHLEKELNQLKQELQQTKQQQMIVSLQSQYPDFNQIVNPNSLAQLEEQEPELAATIGQSQDPYKVLLASYKYIKALGIAGSPESKRAKEVDKKIDKNSKTVQSPLAYDKRPMAQAFNLAQSKEEQKKLYEEMVSHASKVGFSY